MSRVLRRLLTLHENGPIVRRVHLTRDERVTLIAAVVRGAVSGAVRTVATWILDQLHR
jgi:hypothetical protein